MSRIVFFNIPAYGHTNPTIVVVKELVRRGNVVRYYSFNSFREKIESAGAEFVSCDTYLPPLPADFEQRCGYDFAGLIEMIADVTINMGQTVLDEMRIFNPDCIVFDSLCIWGKLFAQKLHIRAVCSTTTFAFNKQTSQMMKPSGKEAFYLISGIPKISKKIRQLEQEGYCVTSITKFLENDDKTSTIVYTSRSFQPQNEQFGENYSFVGPLIDKSKICSKQVSLRPLIYISLGTVMKRPTFYSECLEALRYCKCDVIMSVGSQKTMDTLKNIPSHIQVEISVPQLTVLQNADIFITHCGMNSVHESIYLGVPMILFPQQSEQQIVANRLSEMGMGILLKELSQKAIQESIKYVWDNKKSMQEKLKKLATTFKIAGGAKRAADVIENSVLR